MKHLFVSFVVLGALAIAPQAQADVAANVADACKTLGGTFETSTTGYGSDAVTKFTCRFPDGPGRICDSSGTCGGLVATSTSRTSAASDSSESEDPAADACNSCRKACAGKCSGKGGPRAQLSCRRECIEDGCQAQCS